MTTYEVFQQEQSQKIEKTMVDFLKANTTNEELQEAMIYSVEAGGKRFRPLLFLSTLLFLKQEIKLDDYKVAGAIEMIHTYSLIHDDLPAMDNDDLRRGKPTNHIAFGESTAILAGDGLLTEAFHLIATTKIKPQLLVSVLKELAVASGSGGMIAGQVADIAAEETQVSLNALKDIHAKKTGALILAAIKMACELSGVEEEVSSFLEMYGKHLGLAFQIKDDLLDVIGQEEVIGKPVGSDTDLGKSTYVSLLGIKGARDAFEKHCYLAHLALENAKEEFGYSRDLDTFLDMMLRQLKEKI